MNPPAPVDSRDPLALKLTHPLLLQHLRLLQAFLKHLVKPAISRRTIKVLFVMALRMRRPFKLKSLLRSVKTISWHMASSLFPLISTPSGKPPIISPTVFGTKRFTWTLEPARSSTR